MALTITDTSNKPVPSLQGTGNTLSAHLLGELTRISNVNVSVAGNTLLNPILTGTGFSVTIVADRPTATSGKRVTVNVTETIFDSNDVEKPDGVKEFVESTIFELVNASNHAQFQTLDNQLKSGMKALLPYGADRSDLEATATWTVANILRELAARTPPYVPSAWGQGQVNNTQNYLNGGLVAFKPAFQILPHVNGLAATEERSLPTKEFYAYTGSVFLGGNAQTKGLEYPAELKYGTTRLSIKKISFAGIGQQFCTTNLNTQNKPAAVAYYRAVTELLYQGIPGYTVTWKLGAATNWLFTPAMKAVLPIGGVGVFQNNILSQLLNPLPPLKQAALKWE